MSKNQKMQAAACALGVPKLCAAIDESTEAASSDTWSTPRNALTYSEMTANGCSGIADLAIGALTQHPVLPSRRLRNADPVCRNCYLLPKRCRNQAEGFFSLQR